MGLYLILVRLRLERLDRLEGEKDQIQSLPRVRISKMENQVSTCMCNLQVYKKFCFYKR